MLRNYHTSELCSLLRSGIIMRLNYALYYAQELSCILIMVSITVMNYAYFYVFIIILMIFFVIYFLIEESL